MTKVFAAAAALIVAVAVANLVGYFVLLASGNLTAAAVAAIPAATLAGVAAGRWITKG